MTELSMFPPASFEALLGTYRRLLECSPGKAIRLSPDSAALLVDGRLMWAALDVGGSVDRSSFVEIDEPGGADSACALPAGQSPELFTYCES